jgi:hypothetical protein
MSDCDSKYFRDSVHNLNRYIKWPQSNLCGLFLNPGCLHFYQVALFMTNAKETQFLKIVSVQIN